MTARVAVHHHLSFAFHRPVNLTTLWLRLRPAAHTQADLEAYSIKVHADPNWLNWVRDPFENYLGRLDLPEPVRRTGFDVEFIADLEPVNPFDFFVEPFANDYPFAYPEQLRKELTPYLEPTGPDLGGRERIPPRPPMVLAPTPVSGRFTNQGSGVLPMTAPNQRGDRRFPYLLDLTKAAIAGPV